MTGITQGLYYIEKVQQYNSNIAGFPSDLINDRIASIIDSKKVDMQQSLRLLPVKNVVLNREGYLTFLRLRSHLSLHFIMKLKKSILAYRS